jgi:hypothetical protein
MYCMGIRNTGCQHNFLLHKKFLLLWVIFALLDPDPDPLTRLNPDTDPDPQPCNRRAGEPPAPRPIRRHGERLGVGVSDGG